MSDEERVEHEEEPGDWTSGAAGLARHDQERMEAIEQIRKADNFFVAVQSGDEPVLYITAFQSSDPDAHDLLDFLVGINNQAAALVFRVKGLEGEDPE